MTRSGPIVWIPLAIAIIVMAWGIVDALSFSRERWSEVRRSRRVWTWLQVLLGPMVTVLYVATVRHELKGTVRDLP